MMILNYELQVTDTLGNIRIFSNDSVISFKWDDDEYTVKISNVIRENGKIFHDVTFLVAPNDTFEKMPFTLQREEISTAVTQFKECAVFV